LVALACTAGTRVNNRTGKEIKLPPPATAFRVPAIEAAKNRRMAWLMYKLLFIRKRKFCEAILSMKRCSATCIGSSRRALGHFDCLPHSEASNAFFWGFATCANLARPQARIEAVPGAQWSGFTQPAVSSGDATKRRRGASLHTEFLQNSGGTFASSRFFLDMNP